MKYFEILYAQWIVKLKQKLNYKKNHFILFFKRLKLQEDALNNLVTCKICNQIFEDPVILPCGKTICSRHNEIIKNSCNFCKKIHLVNLNELPVNEEINELIQNKNNYINVNSIGFGENNSIGKESCKLLEEILERAKKISNDPLHFIHEYFSQLKNKIDLTKEQYIQLIEENHEKIINEVIVKEKECKLKANTYLKFSILIQEIETKLQNWNELLKIPDFSKDNEWKKIRFDSQKEINKIQNEIQKYEDELLIYRDYQFVPKPIINNNNFGNLNVSTFETGVIQTKINNFSRLKTFDFEDEGYTVSDESCEIASCEMIIWKLHWRIQKKKKQNLEYFALYITPIVTSDEVIKEKVIKSKISLRIIKNEAINSEIRAEMNLFDHTFVDSTGAGKEDFILKQDLLDPKNGIYNKDDDSIAIEAIIKILN